MGAIVTTPLSIAQTAVFLVVPVANGIKPPDCEALAITCSLQFTPAIQAILIDLTESARKFNEIAVQGAFIDLSQSGIAMQLQIPTTGQVIVAKANTQGYYSLLCPMPAKLIAQLTAVPAGSVVVTVILYNTPIESAVWSSH